jgi:hypothetical protein
MSNDPTVLLTSEVNERFATGFLIFSEGDKSFVVTCAHVVDDLGKPKVQPEEFKVQIVAKGDPNSADLAVLAICPCHPSVPLRLSRSASTSFIVHGYASSKVQSVNERQTGLEKRPLHCVIKAKFGRVSRGNLRSEANAWDFDVDAAKSNGEQLAEGYSGSAVLNESGEAFAVVSYKRDGGARGVAISLDALLSIWPEIPKSLRDAVGSGVTPQAELLGHSVRRVPSVQVPRLRRQGWQLPGLKTGIGKIKAYKWLHDYLHTIQRQSLEQITIMLRDCRGTDPPPDVVMYEVAMYAERCRIIFDALKADIPKLGLMTEERGWVDGELWPAVRMLGEAAGASRIQELKAARAGLCRVLDQQMHRLNRMLQDQSKMLPLNELRSMIDADLELPGRLREIVKGLEALIDIHDLWQELDRQIQILNSEAPTAEIDYLAVMWGNAKESTARLCVAAPEYSRTLAIQSARLDEAIVNRESSNIHSRLRAFSSCAADGFYRVDTDLKRDVTELPELLRDL